MLSATSHIGLEFLTKFLNMSKLQNRLILLYQSLPLQYLFVNIVNFNQNDEIPDDEVSGFANTTKFPTTKFSLEYSLEIGEKQYQKSCTMARKPKEGFFRRGFDLGRLLISTSASDRSPA